MRPEEVSEASKQADNPAQMLYARFPKQVKVATRNPFEKFGKIWMLESIQPQTPIRYESKIVRHEPQVPIKRQSLAKDVEQFFHGPADAKKFIEKVDELEKKYNVTFRPKIWLVRNRKDPQGNWMHIEAFPSQVHRKTRWFPFHWRAPTKVAQEFLTELNFQLNLHLRI